MSDAVVLPCSQAVEEGLAVRLGEGFEVGSLGSWRDGDGWVVAVRNGLGGSGLDWVDREALSVWDGMGDSCDREERNCEYGDQVGDLYVCHSRTALCRVRRMKV